MDKIGESFPLILFYVYTMKVYMRDVGRKLSRTFQDINSFMCFVFGFKKIALKFEILCLKIIVISFILSLFACMNSHVH